MPAWTNPSVRALAGDADPVEVLVAKARALVIQAVQDGWKGPPFDPFELATLLGIPTVPTNDVAEARILGRGRALAIEFNPKRPRSRIRFSVAHEIAHTLFPDCATLTRNRGLNEDPGGDGWELELLCNLAASEFLMPTGDDIGQHTLPSADGLLELQAKFDVSLEAVAIRLAKVSLAPFTVAVASRVGDSNGGTAYRIDYSLRSRTSSFVLPKGSLIGGSLLPQCTAVGYTAKGSERLLPGSPPLYVECVGIPAYNGGIHPRVLFTVTTSEAADIPLARLTMVNGNALEPRGKGPRIIAQVVNDATANWGGGFSLQLKAVQPSAQAQFKEWAIKGKHLHLGRVHFAELKGGLAVASLIAQKGYGNSPTPKIRYGPLKDCLDLLAKEALERGAEVHMPRIGAGLAGGNWNIILGLIDDCLVRKGVSVTVYTLPGAHRSRAKQLGGGQKRLDEALPPPEDGHA